MLLDLAHMLLCREVVLSQLLANLSFNPGHRHVVIPSSSFFLVVDGWDMGNLSPDSQWHPSRSHILQIPPIGVFHQLRPSLQCPESYFTVSICLLAARLIPISTKAESKLARIPPILSRNGDSECLPRANSAIKAKRSFFVMASMKPVTSSQNAFLNLSPRSERVAPL